MSEPKVQRWECEGDEFGEYDMEKNNNGNYVRYEDYARLKAEVERLTAFTTRTIFPNEELQAQVERLTKAGDAMASMLQFEETLNDSDHIPQSVQAWNAAKEGKQS